MPTSRNLAVLSLFFSAFAIADEPTQQQLIDEAVLPLPESLRDDASVIRFEGGRQVILKQGTNGMFCRADDPNSPGIALWCYPRAHDAYARRWYELAAEGNSASEVDDIIAAEIKAGDLEWPTGIVNYNLRGPDLDNAVPVTVVFMPFATGTGMGLPEERDFHRPWLMYAGTAFAHVMIPGQ